MQTIREITEIKAGINRIKFKIAVTSDGGTHTLYLGLETLLEQVINGVEFEVNDEKLAETINELVITQLFAEQDEAIDGNVVYDIYEYIVRVKEQFIEVDYDNFVKTYKRESYANKYVANHNRAIQKSLVLHLEFMK